MREERRSSLPIPTRAPKDSVYAFGEQAATRLGLRPGAPLEPIVSELGGRITYNIPAKLDGRLPESIIVDSDRKFVIYVPTTTSIERDRFTIAHELGHFFLHYPMVRSARPGAKMIATRWVDESDPDQIRCEWEANWFAAAFLMQAGEFRKACTERNNSLSAVAKYFAVSQQPAMIRAQGLGIRLA